MERRLADRFRYDERENILHIDFEGLTVERSTVAGIAEMVDRICGPLKHKVYAVVNYTDFEVLPEAQDAYTEMMVRNQKRYSLGTVRYSRGLLTRTMLRGAATHAKVRSNVCDTEEEAFALVQKLKRADDRS